MDYKVRDGRIFELEKVFENDNHINLWADYYNWGIGIHFSLGDTRKFFSIYFLCIHLDIWF
jgi:hypothetical protein